MTATIEPLSLDVPQNQLDDLADRLALTRGPERETVGDASQRSAGQAPNARRRLARRMTGGGASRC
jgi:hypothetical protein